MHDRNDWLQIPQCLSDWRRGTRYVAFLSEILYWRASALHGDRVGDEAMNTAEWLFSFMQLLSVYWQLLSACSGTTCDESWSTAARFFGNSWLSWHTIRSFQWPIVLLVSVLYFASTWLLQSHTLHSAMLVLYILSKWSERSQEIMIGLNAWDDTCRFLAMWRNCS